MLSARRLPHLVVVGTFAVSGLLATAGVTSVALGAGRPPSVTCPGLDARKPAGGILSCLGGSTAYISTPTGSGSGLVLPGGYVLTNAHVVDPFGQVDLTIGTHKDANVKVVGVDLFADIAVLGPIKTNAKPVHLIDPKALRTGDSLFLVGYPGEANTEDLKPTVADGILSRTRHSSVFGLSYLQTDASIGGGQSGGALVDTAGDVVGISSLSFADNFALALYGNDAQTAVNRILAGKGSPYAPWPGGTPVTTATLPVHGLDQPAILALPAAAQDRTVDISIPGDKPVIVVSTTLESGDPLQTAGNLHEVAATELGVPLAAVAGATQQQLTQFIDKSIGLAEQLRPGTFRFKVPAAQHVFLGFVSAGDRAYDLAVTTSIAAAPVAPSAVKDIKVGDSVTGTVGSVMPFDRYQVTLTKDQKVRIYAGSPSGDMDVIVHGPGLDADGKEYDDSRAGLYGVDVDETFTAPAAGTYMLEVGQVSDAATGYRFSLTDPKATTT